MFTLGFSKISAVIKGFFLIHFYTSSLGVDSIVVDDCPIVDGFDTLGFLVDLPTVLIRRSTAFLGIADMAIPL
jgi:hypothetical protein